MPPIGPPDPQLNQAIGAQGGFEQRREELPGVDVALLLDRLREDRLRVLRQVAFREVADALAGRATLGRATSAAPPANLFVTTDPGNGYCVYCGGCGATGPSAEKKKESVKLWDRRLENQSTGWTDAIQERDEKCP